MTASLLKTRPKHVSVTHSLLLYYDVTINAKTILTQAAGHRIVALTVVFWAQNSGTDSRVLGTFTPTYNLVVFFFFTNRMEKRVEFIF